MRPARRVALTQFRYKFLQMTAGEALRIGAKTFAQRLGSLTGGPKDVGPPADARPFRRGLHVEVRAPRPPQQQPPKQQPQARGAATAESWYACTSRCVGRVVGETACSRDASQPGVRVAANGSHDSLY